MNRILLRIVIALTIHVTVIGALPAAGETESSAQRQEPVVIKWHGSRGFPGDDAIIPDMLAELISKKVGYPVSWELTGTAESNHTPQLEMMLAANDFPDICLYMSLNEEFISQAGAPFALQEMFDYLPQLTKGFRELMDIVDLDEKATWAKYQWADGTMKGIPRIWDLGWVPSGQMWRKDIVDELGYEIPRTLAEAEEVFEAYKAVYPNRYCFTAAGANVTWQSLDLVFNAFGISVPSLQVIDGVIRQEYTTREFRQALQVLRRWYEKGFIDPNFALITNIDKFNQFAAGQHLVVDWIDRGNWDYMSGENTRYLNSMRTNVPDAVAVAAPQLRADENTKPIQYAWLPFLGQITMFGNQLRNDHERMHKIMEVVDLMAMDKEVNYLAGRGIEGEHYFYEEGELLPTTFPEIAAMTEAARIEKWGFGYYWVGTISTFTELDERSQRVIDEYVLDPNGIYGKNNLDLLLEGALVVGAVNDEAGNPVQVATKGSWWQLVIDIMTGVQPIEYYDEWLQFYYDSGGKNWETHATRLYLK